MTKLNSTLSVWTMGGEFPGNGTTVNSTATQTSTPVGLFIHPHWNQFPVVSDEWHYVVGIYMAIIGLTGIFGNFLVIYMFTTTRTLKNPSNMLLVNLALSDLIFSFVNGFPLFTISAFNKKWVFGTTACQLYGLVGGIFGLMSINTLAAISIDRYVVITKPLQAVRTMTRKKVFLMIIAVWIWSFLCAIPPLFGLGAYIPEGFQTSCTFDYLTRNVKTRIHIICLYVFGFAVPLVIIIVCYIMILRAVRLHDQEMLTVARKMNAEDIRVKSENTKSEFRIAKIAMIIVFLYMLSWSPYATVALIAQFGHAKIVNPYVSELPVLLAKASAMYNPIVYALSHPKFRAEVETRMPWLICCKSKGKPKFSTTANSSKRSVTRTESANSDVSSIFSNLSDSASAGQPPISPIELKSPDGEGSVKQLQETSFSNSGISRGNTDRSYTNTVKDSGELVKELVGAVVNMARSHGKRESSVLQSLCIPTRVSLPTTPSQTQHPTNNSVYVVDHGRQIDLASYLEQLATNSGFVSSINNSSFNAVTENSKTKMS